MERCLHLLGLTPDVAARLADFDVRLLFSREERFGAPAQGVPTVCFEGASGAAEFCSGGASIAVWYLSVEGLISASRNLHADTPEQFQMGQMARDDWRLHHVAVAVLTALQHQIATQPAAITRT